MKKNKMIIFIILLINTIIFLGCWDYKEINEKTIASGLAIDKKGKIFITTVEFIAPQSGGGGENTRMIPLIYSTEGNTIFDGIRNLVTKIGKKVFWAHTKVVVISEEIARENIINILDFIVRDAEMRTDNFILISREKTAKEIFLGKDKGHNTLAFHLEDMINNQKYIPKFPVVETWKFTKSLAQEGEASILPTVHVIHSQEQIVPDLYGTAIFKKAKMIAWLNGVDTQYLLLIRNELKGGLIDVIDVAGTGTNITLEIIGTNNKMEVINKEEQMVIKLDIKLDVNITEIDKSIDFISKEGREKLKKEAAKSMKNNIEKLVSKAQKEYKADVFHFAGNIKRKFPHKWEEIKYNWEDYFSNLPVYINVNLDIKGSALYSNPIKVSD